MSVSFTWSRESIAWGILGIAYWGLTNGYGLIVNHFKPIAAAIATFLWIGCAWGQTTIVAALGDSLVHGYGLEPQDGFVPQLEQWLQENKENVSILNAGVSGDTTAGGLARTDWTLTPEVEALIVALGGNDLLRGILADFSRSNLDGILQKAGARGIPVLLVGQTAPENYGHTYKSDFDAIYADLAEKHGVLLFEDFFSPLVEMGDRREVRRIYMQSDGIHPNAKGVKVVVRSLGPWVRKLIARAREKKAVE